ncbi:MAG: S9 family peptidase [Deltaproteobacteria bacterium]|nr:S9 family peptidase [Deltaproteobacteria bacterium]
MREKILLVGLALALACTRSPAPSTTPSYPEFDYPAANRGDVVDVYHGVEVADPYRWLEDPDSDATRDWVAAQNALTFGFLETIPERSRIDARMTELWDYEKYGVPIKQGDRYFYTKNDGLQNQSVLYWTSRLEEAARVLLDPNQLSEDGTVHLSDWAISDDGRYLAYGLAAAGSDWNEWKVRDIDSGKDLADHLEWIKFSGVSWTNDNAGFFYSRYPEPESGAALEDLNFYNKLYYHRIGTPQSEDELIYERPDQKKWGFAGRVSEDGNYLIVSIWKGTDDNNMLLYKRLDVEDGEMVTLIDNFEAAYSFMGNDGPIFYFKTTSSAPRGRIIAIDTRRAAPENWNDIIPQSASTIETASLVGDRFIVSYLKDAHSEVRVFHVSGEPAGDIDLPGIGSTSGFYGRRKDGETFYAYSSFAAPTTIYRYDIQSGESSIFRAPEIEFDPEAYETRQVFAESADGTRVPIFITYKKGLERNGANPTYLYGYGGFNISITPWFSVENLVWMEMGGIYAVATLRGGGEYGEQWHDAGRLLAKQNVFDDFAAAGEWLIANRYTSTPKLAIGGRSNGGLLVGASITQRPDLFGAGLAAVGVMDMLRFQKFTIGWAWVDDYGSSDDPEQFEALLAYSPLHNVEPGTHYPPLLLTTADHDDRVVPAHSFKFAAAMQAAQAGPAPVLIRIETRAGHGSGKPTAKIIEEATDRWAFLVRVLGMAVH